MFSQTGNKKRNSSEIKVEKGKSNDDEHFLVKVLVPIAIILFAIPVIIFFYKSWFSGRRGSSNEVGENEGVENEFYENVVENRDDDYYERPREQQISS